MLISTTVIEVGIDVGNATRLVVYDADRFGLSQLHQLRGRIGRSHFKSVCYLLTSNTDENVIKRLNVLVDHDSGFDIAYQDLLTRGPGEIIGVKQSGLPSFSFGNVIDDQSMLYQAKEDAKSLLEKPSHQQEIDYIVRLKKENLNDNPTID
jgi:ATP-dependent DNA helicase RecG